MAGGWRVTARMVATAAAAAAVSRAAESVRKLLAEASPPPRLDAPRAPAFLEPPTPLTTPAAMQPPAPAEDRIVAAQSGPAHEFGPIPSVVPSHGIGFRSEPRRREPAAEMPVISRPSSDEPSDRESVAPAAPVVMPKSVRTAAAFVQDLEETSDDIEESEDRASEDAPADEPEPPVADEAADDEPAQDPVAEPEAEREQPPADAQPEPQPEPEPQPVRTLRLTAPPIEETPLRAEPAPTAELVEPVEPIPTREVEEPAATSTKPDKKRRKDELKDKKAKAKQRDKGKHRRHTSAISGTVQSSRGRGLRGMRVDVLDDRDRVIGTAVTGTGGTFVVEDLPAGIHRLTVNDLDGDFAPGWHGGPTPAKAQTLKVKPGKTRRKAAVTLVSTADVDIDTDIRKKKAVVEITVTDRATGTPAEGSVRVSTKLFSTDLPLTQGRTAITLRGSATSKPALSKKVTVDYSGSRHTRPQTAKAKLR